MKRKRKEPRQKSGISIFTKWLGSAASYIIGEGIDAVKRKAQAELEDVRLQVKRTVRQVLRQLTLIVIAFIGAIFILAGLGKYLSEIVPSLGHGLGYVLVGGILIAIALLIRLFIGDES